jgi:hypothetical protein
MCENRMEHINTDFVSVVIYTVNTGWFINLFNRLVRSTKYRDINELNMR